MMPDNIRMDESTEYWYRKGMEDISLMMISFIPENDRDNMTNIMQAMTEHMHRTYKLLEEIHKRKSN